MTEICDIDVVMIASQKILLKIRIRISKKKYFWAKPKYYEPVFLGFLTEGYNK